MRKIGVMPKIGDYSVPINILIEHSVGCKMMDCPPITARTVEVGAKHSPDTVCTPFKITLGNFIEALDNGASVLFMPGFGCRLGFYDMLHEQILKDLGYKFEMVAVCDYTATPNRIFNSLNQLNSKLTREEFDAIFALVCRIVLDMDELAQLVRLNAGFELEKGNHEKLYQAYLNQARKLCSYDDALALGKKYKTAMKKVKTERPNQYLRIGIVGDSYSVLEPHGNCEMVKWLTENKVEVHKPADLTHYANYTFDVNKCISASGGYVKYNLGGNANISVALAYQMASKSQVDGIIHVKAATCSPEISAMTILQDIAKDFQVPFMYMTFDTETGEAGVHTRLEAFCDMLAMKKSKEKKAV